MCHCPNDSLCDSFANALLSFYPLEFIMDCNFDQGACEWVQDKADDLDWSVAYHRDGNRIINMSLSSYLRLISCIHISATNSLRW